MTLVFIGFAADRDSSRIGPLPAGAALWGPVHFLSVWQRTQDPQVGHGGGVPR